MGTGPGWVQLQFIHAFRRTRLPDKTGFLLNFKKGTDNSMKRSTWTIYLMTGYKENVLCFAMKESDKNLSSTKQTEYIYFNRHFQLSVC